ncbi:protein mahjong-like [Drosophila miranda]|uniref:protein mahjong-like n=1 Tax=Drosophila miranda TaxID=7229 RepID=UPI00143F1359|nr:protein mahjong-like [Drosophila miranda]
MSEGGENGNEALAGAAQEDVDAEPEREAIIAMAQAVEIAYESDDDNDDEAAAEEAGAEEDAMSGGDAEAAEENESDSSPAADDAFGNQEEDTAADRRSSTKKELTQIIDRWEQQQTQSGYDPVPTLKSLAEIFEREKDAYMRKDPDPLDSRHPYRADPSCQYGLLLKLLFRKDVFMGKLLNDYLRENYFSRQTISRSSLELNILACRLILEIMPGLETTAVFQTANDDGTINRIYSWADDSIEPLQSYATGLLAEAIEVSDTAINYRDQNMRLVPKMIKRLQRKPERTTHCGTRVREGLTHT